MQSEKREIRTVHERDLDKLLIKLSKSNKFNIGDIKCKFCKRVVDNNNLYSLFAESGCVNFICNQTKCITSFMEYKSEKNNIK